MILPGERIVQEAFKLLFPLVCVTHQGNLITYG